MAFTDPNVRGQLCESTQRCRETATTGVGSRSNEKGPRYIFRKCSF